MVSYAAVPINSDTILALFAHVSENPDGHSRLAWAMFRYPWVEGCEYYFIGGNYLGLSYPNYIRQILTRSQLDSWFTYDKKSTERRNGPRPNGWWFVVTPRKEVIFRASRNKDQEEITA